MYKYILIKNICYLWISHGRDLVSIICKIELQYVNYKLILRVKFKFIF